VERLTRIHRINQRVRRLGLKPTPPGVSPLRDEMKLAASRVISGVRGMRSQKAPPRRPYAVWTPSK
jgi:hypothetical protein